MMTSDRFNARATGIERLMLQAARRTLRRDITLTQGRAVAVASPSLVETLEEAFARVEIPFGGRHGGLMVMGVELVPVAGTDWILPAPVLRNVTSVVGRPSAGVAE
jgi:hypothetical protein